MHEVEELLRHELRSQAPFVDEVVRYSFKLGGKRLRPALLLLTAKACGGMSKDHITLGAVVEMIHTATLVHDDVLDEAEQRRHLASVNARWNNETSVLLGDFLFTHSFFLAATLDSTFACRRIGESTNIVCEGELMQVGNRGNYDLEETEYFAIINGKTAELTACCCHLGAHYANANPEVAGELEAYGRHLGLAFQIADDLLDLLGDEQNTGKSLGTDLEKEKATLPLIHTLRTADPTSRETIMALLQNPSVNSRSELVPWLEKFGSLDYARQIAEKHARKASECLRSLPDSPAKNVLEMIAEFVVARSC